MTKNIQAVHSTDIVLKLVDEREEYEKNDRGCHIYVTKAELEEKNHV
jgi:hypothetical protein